MSRHRMSCARLTIPLLILAITAWGTSVWSTSGPSEGTGQGKSSPTAGQKYTYDYFDNFYGIASAAGGERLWIVGNSGRILHSGDGGKSWEIQASRTSMTLYSVTFPDPLRGWCSGVNGTILHTGDGGATWTTQASGTEHPIFKIRFLNENVGFACGYFGLFLRTVDGGKTWEDKSIGEDVTLRGMSFPDEKTGFLAGEFGKILKTENGGDSFLPLDSTVSVTLFDLHFLDERRGYAVGIDGTVLETRDGGSTWVEEESGVKDHLVGVFGEEAGVVAVGLRGSITAKEKGGRWTPGNSKTLNWLAGVLLGGPGQGFVVGSHGTILRLGEVLGNGSGREK